MKKKTPVTKKEAISHAKRLVGPLYRFGDQWRFSSFDSRVIAWRESTPANYQQARNDRSERLLNFANSVLGYAEKQYDGGRWESYL